METKKLESIGIILDGNRRWAKEHGVPSSIGHKEGAKKVEEIVRYANSLGLKSITVYAFSTENWKRTQKEISYLMRLFQSYLDYYAKKADSENIKVNIIGSKNNLSTRMIKSIEDCMDQTKNNTGIIFNIALNYGGRLEITEAVKQIAQDFKDEKIKLEDIDEELISNSLFTKGQKDPDLIIRTSGEKRLSNFLTWQSTYSELYFVDKCWPDFTKQDLDLAIEEYYKRNRKFGAN